jgi:ribonuclease J
VVVVAVDADTAEVIEGPDIITRGFVYIRESGDLIEDAALCVLEALEHREAETNLSAQIRDRLANYLYEQTKRRPIILPVVMEV